ncbi:hypothetical protein QR680_001003 [Steinernema hermaphroditum]|uniref:C2 domain-containing protein n=1 Tax=Steinernema hermaphroditum TaxID=289476 RepID=A0AA39LF29_9BILA|nr:hypothetical protein QR680_001003 [Steinernema hermaphroditum]
MWNVDAVPGSSSQYHHPFGLGGLNTVMGGNHRLPPPSSVVAWNSNGYRRRRFEAFCSPVVPHVPIRQRLSQSRRCNSADVHEVESFHAYGPRRRRMSLLQNLRYQNKQLADSGFNCHSQRTDSDPQNDHFRAFRHDSASESPERHRKTTSFSSFSNIKAKTKAFFRKERKGSSQRAPSTDTDGAKSSTDCLSKDYRRKSPSTNDSGHGSQGRVDEIIHEDVVCYKQRRPSNSLVGLFRKSNSCPHLEYEINTCRCGARAPICKSDLSEDFSIPGSSNSIIFETHDLDDIYENALRNCSPVSAIDHIIRRRLERKAQQQSKMNGATPRHMRKASLDETNIVEIHRNPEDDDDDIGLMIKSRSNTSMTEKSTLYGEDNASIFLEQFLPDCCNNLPSEGSSRSSSEFSLFHDQESRANSQSVPSEDSSTTTSVAQTDLSLISVSDLSDYLSFLHLLKIKNREPTIEEEGMNFIAKHFFEYQSFMNLPYKAVQLHKTPPSQAGADPSAAWAPKSMHKAGKNQPAPASRANRNNVDTRVHHNRHGRAGKHEFREWGDKHGDFRSEKIVPHKDAWTKFLANEEPGKRTVFECDFEDRILQLEPDTLQDKLENTDEVPFAVDTNKEEGESELLVILTYASQVQFVTATIKKVRTLPYNNNPFARVMLFDGRRLVEQKQTTINTGVVKQRKLKQASSSSSSSCLSTESSESLNSQSQASFSESFLFHVPPQQLERSHVVIEIYDREDPSSEAVLVGHCVIGPLASGCGSLHWRQMVRKHGFPVCMWHRLNKNT